MSERENMLPARFWSRIHKSSNGCWIWAGRVGANGYGRYDEKNKDGNWVTKVAHRVAYKKLVCDVANNLDLHHECRNRRCCNPAHLIPMTHADNLAQDKVWEVSARKRRQRKYCANGHLYTLESTYWRKDG